MKTKINNFIKYIKHGGVTNVNVTFVNPSERYVGKKVFVSGASEGIGKAIAIAYLNEGAEVIVTGRARTKLEVLENELACNRLHTYVWDASDFALYNTKFMEMIEIMGHIDIFINNVGGGITKYEAGLDYPEDVLDSTFQLNSKSMFLLCQLEGKYMINNNIHGNILNITSVAGFKKQFNPYAMAKWGCNAITGGLARKLIQNDIVVNGIAPGTCLTSNPAIPQGRVFNENAYFRGHPSHRFTMPEEIAKAALYLTSGEARQIVGYVLPIDGGSAI